MRKKTIIASIITCIMAVILLIGIRYGYKKYSEYKEYYMYTREFVILGPETQDTEIYIEPDDTATRAAANYLAFSVEQTFGTTVEIVTEQNEDFRGIRILCGTEIPEQQGLQKAQIVFITTAEAADDNDEEVYTVILDENKVSIYVAERENCFSSVKAVTDRWFQKDCGLESADKLRISHSMIDRQLSRLPIAVTGEFRILTQNLRYCDDPDGKSIVERAARFVQLVEEYQPDLIGAQECTSQWLQLLQESFEERYGFYGNSSSEPGASDGWYDIILYRKERFSVINGETFWLSNTPSEPNTKLNYNGISRICTWALLSDSETGKTLLFSNTHLQDGGHEQFGEVRDRQAEILLRRLRKGNDYLSNYPGFLTGDFNGTPKAPFYSRITQYYEDSKYTAIVDSSTVDYSYQNYGSSERLLDYCFHSPKNVTVLDYHILDDQYDGYVSDHFGILVTAIIN